MRARHVLFQDDRGSNEKELISVNGFVGDFFGAQQWMRQFVDMLAAEVRACNSMFFGTPTCQRVNDFFQTRTHWNFLYPMRLVLLAVVSMLIAGCADQGYKVKSVTYEYTDQTRLADEWRAMLTAQDDCYFSGSEYAQLSGPPRVIRDGGHFRATQSFYCVGIRGEG